MIALEIVLGLLALLTIATLPIWPYRKILGGVPSVLLGTIAFLVLIVLIIDYWAHPTFNVRIMP